MSFIRNKIEDGRIGKLSGYARYLSFDEKVFFVQIYYFGTKFLIERSYQNTDRGKKDSIAFLKQFKKDEDILKYFNVKGPLKMNIEKIVEEIRTQREHAKEVLENGNPSTQTFRAGRRQSAIENLSRLEELYKENLKNNMIAVIVQGTQSELFVNKAMELVEMPSVLFDSLTREILRTIPAASIGKYGVSWIVDKINDSLDEAALLMNTDAPFIEYKTDMDTSITTEQNLKDFVTNMVETHVGNDFMALFAIESAAQKALNMLYEGKRFAFTLPVDDVKQADLANKVMQKQLKYSFLVMAGRQGRNLETEPVSKLKEVTEESVMEALNAIKQLIK